MHVRDIEFGRDHGCAPLWLRERSDCVQTTLASGGRMDPTAAFRPRGGGLAVTSTDAAWRGEEGECTWAGWTSVADSAIETATDTESEIASFTVGGMTCGACAARIERRLNRLDGVVATVNYASERARVVMPAGVPPARVIEEIESTGYSASFVSDEAAELDQQAAAAERRVRSLRWRLIVSASIFMPLCEASFAFWLVPQARFTGWQWLLVVLTVPVVTWAAWPFYSAAARNLRHGTFTMDVLVSMGIIAATGWSLYAMFWLDAGHGQQATLSQPHHLPGGAIYLDVAAGVTTFLLAGRYFEATWRLRSGSALRSLAKIGAKAVSVLDASGVEARIPIAHLHVGDRFIVRPGETVATDGLVESGRSSIDTSAMTGESTPHEVETGDRVLGGTVAADGRLIVRATGVGADTQLAHMVRLVEEAQNQKAAAQRLADRISGVFVPTVIAIAGRHLSRLAGRWGQCCGRLRHGTFGADHRLSVRARARDADSAAGRIRAGRACRHLLQAIPSARAVARCRHRGARQDRDAHGRSDDGRRRGERRRGRSHGRPAVGRRG